MSRTPNEILATGAAWVTESELAELVDDRTELRRVLQEIADAMMRGDASLPLFLARRVRSVLEGTQR